MIFLRRDALLCLLLVASTMQAFAAESIKLRVVPAITDNYILEDYRPSGIGRAPQIKMVVAPDEYEPASFVVFANEQIDDLQLSATSIGDSKGKALPGASLDIRIVKRWYQRDMGNMVRSNPADMRLRFLTPELLLYDDALIKTEGKDNYLRLQSGEYINISKSGRVKGLITPRPEEFSVRDASVLQPLSLAKDSNRQIWLTVYVPPDAAAGNYGAEIRVLQGEQQLAVVPVLIEVLPFQLDDPQIDYSIYYRGKLDNDWPRGSVSSEYKSEEQMSSDFQNLVAHGINNPMVYQRFSTGLLDQVLTLRKAAGMDKPRLLYTGVPEAGGDGRVSPRLSGTITDVLNIAENYGIEDVYFYARDEAKSDLLRAQYPYWDLIKKAGGKVMAAGWQTDGKRDGNFDVTGGREDLFVSLGTVRSQEARRWHSKGRLIYSYQNPTGGWEIPATWRRNYGLLLWQNEYDGGMPYAWQHSYGNVWNDFDHYKYKDHNFTYPTVDGQIDTVQWEGLREAVDDVRYLSTLINALADAEREGLPQASEARAWLNQLKDRPLGQSDLAKIRAEMVAYIVALNGLSPVDMSGAIEDLRVLPIEPGGVATVAWETVGRSMAFIEIKQDGAKVNLSSQGLAHYHELNVAALKPNRKYPFVAYSYFDADGSPISHGGAIDTATQLNITTSQAQSDDELKLNVDVRSNYRASIGVDWQRSLTGWWRFSSAESPGVDNSTWEHKADLKWNAESTAGWFGSGVSLDGEGSFVNMSEIDIPENGPATIEGWFRFRSFAMDNRVNMGLFSGIYQHMSNNQLYFSGTNVFFLVGSLLNLNTWHHIALTWNGDEATAVMYVDGQPRKPVVRGDIEPISSIDGLSIGRSSGYLGGLVGPATNTFDGDIDEIRAWSRALSEAEIQASYNAHKSDLRFAFPLDAKASPEFSLIGANAADQLAVD